MLREDHLTLPLGVTLRDSVKLAPVLPLASLANRTTENRGGNKRWKTPWPLVELRVSVPRMLVVGSKKARMEPDKVRRVTLFPLSPATSSWHGNSVLSSSVRKPMQAFSVWCLQKWFVLCL